MGCRASASSAYTGSAEYLLTRCCGSHVLLQAGLEISPEQEQLTPPRPLTGTRLSRGTASTSLPPCPAKPR